MNKFCKDCKWCNPKFGMELAKCEYIKKMKIRKTDGKKVPVYQHWRFCDILRENTFIDYIFCYTFGICGPQGRYFKRRRKNDE